MFDDYLVVYESADFVADRFDPAAHRPRARRRDDGPLVAIVGSGPAGLTAAHYLSLAGCRVTVFERDAEPGGMLVSGRITDAAEAAFLKQRLDELEAKLRSSRK